MDDTDKNAYAYTWWVNKLSEGNKQVEVFQASGWAAQEIIVIPDQKMVVVFTGGNYTMKKHIY